jgi:hypothetical protein
MYAADARDSDLRERRLDHPVQHRAKSSGFLPLFRTDGNTKSVSVAYKLWPRHSRRAFFSAGCIGKGFAEASVLVAWARCS